jgi:integrase
MGCHPGPLFCPINKGGRLVRTKTRKLSTISDPAIYWMLIKRAAQAGIERFSLHDLRRSFGSDLLDAGGDISMVQKLAVHANIATTVGYDRRPEAAKKKTAELLHFPCGTSPIAG